MHKAFIVWELVPEETKYFLLENLSDEEMEQIKSAHNVFVNQTGPHDAAKHLHERLLREQPLDSGEPFELPEGVCVVVSGLFL